MAFEDDETLQLFIEEAQEHLSDIESDLLEIESGGENIDVVELTHFSGRLISFRERSSKWAPKSYIQQRFGNKWLSWSDPVAVQPI